VGPDLCYILPYFRHVKKHQANRFVKKTLDFYKKAIFFNINYALLINEFFLTLKNYEMSIL
jgi:hypothetical protein